ncbi:hypothetical protein Nepgr_003151 [Nepenthes gracilis]|uniref:Uncharacterized protein n=1 Tax=Nepenthes gracilis TaxID=150966 RepID=A0AAD3RZ01_NEPGR|nr:hypothetical protein Nepgr_003151 [Nepenthes gracilis]
MANTIIIIIENKKGLRLIFKQLNCSTVRPIQSHLSLSDREIERLLPAAILSGNQASCLPCSLPLVEVLKLGFLVLVAATFQFSFLGGRRLQLPKPLQRR